MKPDELDATFHALASEPRRRMLDWLVKEPGCNVARLCECFEGELSRFGVMKHLQVLERGNLVISRKEGRERLLWFNAAPMQLIHERWSTELSAYWAPRLTALKYAAEGAEVHSLFPTPKRKSQP
ncbi:ArsR/SmtB family transcription factor [Paucibacter sp. JuS9]|uniref:ArsR/SmtB family transcription factor n=1 Tax=Roseateles TaxID=93681 RepID=UPI002FE62997